MHQETLLYMWHRLPHAQKRAPRGLRYERGGAPPPRQTMTIPAGAATLGASAHAIPFGWDNEFGAHRVDVGAFEIDVHSVTNAEFLEFVDAGGYRTPGWWSERGWQWREHDGITHPAFWVARGRASGAGAACSRTSRCRPRGRCTSAARRRRRSRAGAAGGCRPSPSIIARRSDRPARTRPRDARRFPWGEAAPDASRGNFDFASWEPVPAGARPLGASAWGVHDLVGNGWEWTSTVFGPFPGFEPMASYPEYSADFFDGQHYVIKGASPATARELVRRASATGSGRTTRSCTRSSGQRSADELRAREASHATDDNPLPHR